MGKDLGWRGRMLRVWKSKVFSDHVVHVFQVDVESWDSDSSQPTHVCIYTGDDHYATFSFAQWDAFKAFVDEMVAEYRTTVD